MDFTSFPNLVTERLHLRAINLEDAEEVFILRSDQEILKYIAHEPLKTVDEAADWIEKYAKNKQGNTFITWALTLKGDDKLFGSICIWNIVEKNFRGEIGYSMLPEYQGNGYMCEAIKEVLRYGFDTLKLHSIEGHINPENLASIKALERNGFVKEGHLKQNQCLNGIFYDTAIYSLINPKD